jgi:hypothetical protein
VIKQLPPAAGALLPEKAQSKFKVLFDNFVSYISGREAEIKKVIDRMYDELTELNRLKERQARDKKDGKIDLEDYYNAIRIITDEIQTHGSYSSMMSRIRYGDYDYDPYGYNYEKKKRALELANQIKKGMKVDPVAATELRIKQKLAEIENQQYLLRTIRESPNEIPTYMSWLEWFKSLDFDAMLAELERVDNTRKGKKYVQELQEARIAA